MQKKLIALAIAAAASGAAFAQTNVTIYGIADVGFAHISNKAGDSKSRIDSGILSTSRIGFKGVEDLGNGLKAVFTLEYGLAMDQNTSIGATSAAARQQFVGLTGGFGTVVAGRLQTAGLDFTVAGSALGGSSTLGAINQVNRNGNHGGAAQANGTLGIGLINAAARANNAVAYVSPSFGGLTLAVNHARHNVNGDEGSAADKGKGGSATLVAANYENGGLSVGAVYGFLNEKDTAGILAADDKVKEWGLRAGYDFGVAKIQAAYQRQKLDFDLVGDQKNNKWVVSATVPVTAKAAVIAEYAQAKVNDGDDKNKAFTLAATYSLSKRTTAYAGYVGIRPDSDFRSNANNKKLTENRYGVGLRHAF